MAEKVRSLRALDALNFFNAGIQTGLGPFIALFYATERHWNPGQIGILLGVQSLAGVVTQTAMGHAIDQTERKQLVTGIAALVVALGCVGVVTFQTLALQIAVQTVIGVAVTVFPATTSAFALGMVDEKELSGRVARNESFTHGGNVIFAIFAAAMGILAALHYIFFVAAAFATGMAAASAMIRAQDVDYQAARAGDRNQGNNGGKGKSWRELLGDKRIPIFTAVVVLFNVSNASTLPLVSQLLAKGQKGAPVWQTAACVVVAELVMVLVAYLIGGRADSWGRKPLFLIAFAVLALRNGLTVVSHGQGYLISLQAGDGVAAAIYGVLLTLVVADLAKGTGRFNFLQGAIQSAMGLGGFLSNLAFGHIAHAVGFNASFLGLSAVAVVGGLFYLWKMPETKPQT